MGAQETQGPDRSPKGHRPAHVLNAERPRDECDDDTSQERSVQRPRGRGLLRPSCAEGHQEQRERRAHQEVQIGVDDGVVCGQPPRHEGQAQETSHEAQQGTPKATRPSPSQRSPQERQPAHTTQDQQKTAPCRRRGPNGWPLTGVAPEAVLAPVKRKGHWWVQEGGGGAVVVGDGGGVQKGLKPFGQEGLLEPAEGGVDVAVEDQVDEHRHGWHHRGHSGGFLAQGGA